MSRLRIAEADARGEWVDAVAAEVLGEFPPGGLLQVIPVPDTRQALVITARIVPAAEARTWVAGEPTTAEAGGEQLEVDADDLVIQREARRVWSDGREVRLTFQEFELLAYLSARPGKVFSRVHLMNALWQQGAVPLVPRTVDVHVHRLRRKLGRHAGRLVTVRRAGYCYRPPEDRPRDPARTPSPMRPSSGRTRHLTS